ncbi:hypothetical protein RI129_001138 [Pyrocoelia pectoralis]|uniref:THAP-type domain-containing protein n=1 Tax=Pyrocoelia pectoralis TaxID=417401 RepID=A0AAN7VTH8_9COLE
MEPSKRYYKWCFVPMCTNTTFTTPEKTFLTMPRDVKIRKMWFKAARRDYSKITSSDFYCCEDHFDLKLNTLKFKVINKYVLISRNCVVDTIQKKVRLLLIVVTHFSINVDPNLALFEILTASYIKVILAAVEIRRSYFRIISSSCFEPYFSNFYVSRHCQKCLFRCCRSRISAHKHKTPLVTPFRRLHDRQTIIRKYQFS